MTDETLETLSSDVPPTVAAGDGSPLPLPEEMPPPGRRAVVAVVIAALATDLAMWTTGPGLAWTLGATAAAVAVAIGARPTTRTSYALLAVVPLLAVWCSLRTSMWLLVPNLIVINLCLLLAAALARRGRWFDQSFPGLLLRLTLFVESFLMSSGWFGGALTAGVRRRGSAEGGTNWRSLVVGAVVATPIVVTLVVLLASADAVFASFFDIGLDGSVVARHVIFLLGGAWAMMALLHRAAAPSEPHLDEPPAIAAATANVVLAAVAAVFGLYATSRLLALTGMAERIATTRGLTWAEYARSGFFQLLAVAAITALVLLVVRGWSVGGTTGQRRLRRSLALVIVVLVLGVIIDAISRLEGYDDAYGATMLRLYSTTFAVWLGVVFGIIGVSFVVAAGERRWLTPAIGMTVLAAVFAMNVVNPEAVVAARNLGEPTEVGSVDLTYLQLELTDDAIPTIVDHLGDLSAEQYDELTIEACYGDRSPAGFLNPNRSRHVADRLLADLCAS